MPAAGGEQTAGRGERRCLVAAGGAATLGALLFLPALWSGRIADDYVLEQTLAHTTNLGAAFSHNDLAQGGAAGHFYRPLWVLWNLAMAHLSHGPLLAHVGNLVLFAVLCAEVVALGWLLTRRVTVAAVAGLLFAVFPSHGESVAWISGNTDLLAGVLGMACVLVALARRPGPLTDLAVLVLALLAMLAKEIAFVLPLLLVLVGWAAPTGWVLSVGAGFGLRSARWRPVWIALVAAIGVFVLRAIVIGGVGGYGPAFTLKRLVASAVTFVFGALSPPQLALVRHPVLLVVPVVLLLGGLALVVRLVRAGDADGARLMCLGVGWFVVGLLPVLNEPLDLNTRNGDRLLLLSSVGLVLAVAALIDLRRVWGRCVLAALVVVGGLSCLQNAFAWHAAGVESDRLIGQVTRLASGPGAIVALSFPTDLGEAHLFPDALAAAVQEHGRPGVEVVTCAPMHPLTLRAGQTRFVALRGGVWLGRTTASNPFAVGVLSAASVSAGPGCSSARVAGARSAGIGTTLQLLVTPASPAAPQNILYFDGRDFVRALRR